MSPYADQGISVIMPVHNAGAYLSAAVRSILRQTHPKLELILIDDHSDDGAIEMLPPDSRLVVIQSDSRGIVSALNKGIAHAEHSVIARMDGDDISLENRLEVQLKLLLDSPKNTVVGSQIELFRDDTDIGGGYRRYQEWINQQLNPEQIEKNFWIESCIPHPTAMMHTECLNALGGYHDSPWPEDYDLWCRAHLAGYTFCKPQNQVLLRWRDYPNRTSRTQSRYSIKHFLQCKAYYLSKVLLSKGVKQCVIWGTGPTGTKLHRFILSYGLVVTAFIDVNPKLIGRKKHGKPIYIVGDSPSDNELKVIQPLVLIAVRSWGARDKIRSSLVRAGYQELHDFIMVA